MGSLPDQTMDVVVECDKIAVDRVTIAHSWMEKKPVLSTCSHDAISEINPPDLLFISGDWPGTVAIEPDDSASLWGAPAPRFVRSMNEAGRIHQCGTRDVGARPMPPQRPTAGPLHGQSAVRRCTRDRQLAPLPVVPLAFNLLFRSLTS